MSKINASAAFFIVLLFGSCANIVSPTGGPKDTQPPQIVTARPLNYSANFSSKKIVIEFNEFIQLKDLQQQLVISPSVSPEPEIEVKGKKLLISVGDSLLPNTTYTLNFGSALADITESNVSEQFRYVFSTGDFLDTLSMSGFVYNASDKSTEKNISVMLYPETDDSLPYKKKPFYVAKTNTSGAFRFSNIRAGTFKLVALGDQNNNLLYDPPQETIGFYEYPVSVETDTALKIFLFKEIPSRLFFEKSESVRNGMFRFVLNRPYSMASVKISDGSVSKESISILEKSMNNDTLTWWIHDTLINEVRFLLHTDSSLADTVVLKIPDKGGPKGSSLKKRVPFILSGNMVNRPVLNYFENPSLEFSNPILRHDVEKIIIREDSLEIKNFRVQFTDSVKRKMEFVFDKKENTRYSIFIPPDVFSDMFGNRNDTLKTEFRTNSGKDFGTVNLKLNMNGKPFPHIVQLLNEKNNVIRQYFFSEKTTLEIKHLDPATYRLKIISDKNGNGLWDTEITWKKYKPRKWTFIRKTSR